MTEAARQPVYVFEGFRLDAQRRVLFGSDGQPIALTPRVLDTLLYFVERAGQLLTKEELLEALWPNVVVEEHNLNKTVSELRRVLGEKPGEHKFIVTKPGRGYRFVAGVSLQTAVPESRRAPLGAGVPESSAVVPKPRVPAGVPLRGYSVWIAATLILLTAGGLALVGNRATGPREPQMRVTRWSTDKGGHRGPVWSPDSRAAAFMAQRSASEPYELYVRELDSPVARAIARPESAEFAGMAQWTSDNKILFWDHSGLWSVSPVGGRPVPVAAIDFDYELYGPTARRVMDVTRDGSVIASLGRTDDGYVGVFTATLPDAKFVRYTPDPFVSPVGQGYNEPFLRFSPDGKQLLLWRHAGRQSEEAWLLPFPPNPSRPPRRVLEGLSAGSGTPEFSWLPDNRHILVSTGPMPPRTLYIADTQSGRYRPLSSGLVGPSAQRSPVVSPDGDKLVYTDLRVDYDVVTLDLHSAAVTPLIDGDQVELMPAWAADASALVYVTFRSGGPEIWLHQPPQPDRPLVTERDFKTATRAFLSPALSPDGARIIYERVEGPNIKSQSLWMSAINGGDPVRLTNEAAAETGGSWSPDGEWYVYFVTGGGTDTLKKVRTTGEAVPQTLLTEPSLIWLPVWSPDGQWILLPDAGILVSADGTRHELGTKGVGCTFSKTQPLLYCLQPQGDERHWLVELDFDGRLVRSIGPVSQENLPATGLRPGLRLSLTPDGTGVTYSISKISESLQLLEGLADLELP